MYKCLDCNWEFKTFKHVKVDWSDSPIEVCPNCSVSLFEGAFISIEGEKLNNSKRKIIPFKR